RAADVNVIFNLRLKNLTDPADDVRLAKYIMTHYSSQLTSFTIGNEPNVYFKQYADYRAMWKKFADAIEAAVPGAPLNGPSTTPGKTFWAREFAGDFAGAGFLRLVTQHAYPGGNARLVADPAAARAKILAAEMDKSYETFYQSFVPAVWKNHEQFRLEEANSLFHGGATGVSNSFASALWGLDFMHWWAEHGAEGINFHTGNHFTVDEQRVPGGYDISYSTPRGLETHPMAYALKAFSLSNRGKCIPVTVESGQEKLNLTAYAVADPQGELILTVINKEIGRPDVLVRVNAGPAYRSMDMMRLMNSDGDPAAVSGSILGGSEIAGDGAWNGAWSAPQSEDSSGRFAFHLPSAAAAVVRIRP
ncbi:MAG TPA: hypothetical protein VL992_08525, partial [Tepidisphaeraceae bacterium]|nr:hypothetical protein [Tepidisphaeraceae bacterium]